MVEGGLPPAFPSTIKSTFLRNFSTSAEESSGGFPRSLAEVKKSGPVSSRIRAKRGCLGMRMPMVLKLLK